MPDENLANLQPSPTLSPSQTKKPLNWKLIGITTIVAAVLIGGGGYLVYNAYQPKGELAPTTTTSTKTSTPSTTKKEEPKDETADWKTYTNSKFSIKYPPSWVTRKCGNETVFFAPKDQILGICQSGFSGLIDIATVDIEFSTYKKQQNSSAYDNYMQENTNISGKEAIKIIGTYNGSVEGTPNGAKRTVYLVSMSGKTLAINYVQQVGWDDNLKKFELIVSTFKFLP